MNNSIKSSMYVLKPVCNLPDRIELPKNMYHLPKIGERGKELEMDVLRVIQDKGETKNSNGLENRWDRVLEDLHDLAEQLAEIRKSVCGGLKNNELELLDGAVIYASPKNPPYSLLLLQMSKSDVNFNITCYRHSSVDSKTVCPDLGKNWGSGKKVDIAVIWKDGSLDTKLVLNPIKFQPILGEVNILRFFARLGLDLGYDENNETLFDSILDECHKLIFMRTIAEKSLIRGGWNEKLAESDYFGGKNFNIVDIAVWSVLKQNPCQDVGRNLKNWFEKMNRFV